ncbi:MAG: aminotransferase class III-fold pyridoxal phosphate-dependent enzyme [Henriciella sp.]|uniref:aminotransferase class III-fold pyridoxal phosphate-dependent enzyme n=1 Tax=Henriciella sp. TaxID=1968823 RepID=UPI003C77216F
MHRETDRDLRDRAKKVLPNGVYGHQSTALLPGAYPQFFSKAKGAYLWDADGNKYLDFMCAYGPNLLGYADERVNKAAIEQLARGDAMTGPSSLMVELAEVMVDMVSHADWAMFCKNGTDATTMAKTIARAQTDRRVILVAAGAYHGSAPWCTPRPAGVIADDRAFVETYEYNNIESLESAVAAAGDDLAAVFAAPFKHDAFTAQALPDPAYAQRARALCDETGAMLIVDDIRAGFRLARDCSWEAIGVRPDLSTWGKSFANGLPISALLGADRARKGAASIYATGSFWFSAVPMAAALETLKILRETDYLEHIVRLGDYLREGLDEAASKAGLPFNQTGPVQMPLFLFDDDPDFRIGFAWSEAMLRRGIYVHPWHNMFFCQAMSEHDMDLTITAAIEAFEDVKHNMQTLEPHPVVAKMVSS